MAPPIGLENRRSGDVTEGSNPSLSANFCGFLDKDDAAQDAPFTPRSGSGDGASVGTPNHRPRLLDLFCCAGGAGMGYHLAGFDVVGVDARPQPRYPFRFIQMDIRTLTKDDLRGFDAIHASPPCQAHTSMKTMPDSRPHLDLIPETRALLRRSGLPYVIENVPGAPLIDPVRLCGSMFGLGAKGAQLRRHRDFETNWFLMSPGQCRHSSPTIGIYGEGCRDSRRKHDKTIPEFTVVDGREAMGMPWATLAELCEAIPPAYTRFIGTRLLAEMAPHLDYAA